jgi:hypothetical protein
MEAEQPTCNDIKVDDGSYEALRSIRKGDEGSAR